MADLYLPSKIKVGFQNREDCYTKKLAYVIYYDGTGKLRKEASWNSWRNSKIEPKDFDNVPTSGFVLNRPVGGVKESYGWNTRNSYIRVYDPRGFEFEITLENLLLILEVCDSIKGKGLIGDFVYGWAGTELVLLPTETTDYKSSVESTVLKNTKFSLKDLVIGKTYQFKDKSKNVYVGHEYIASPSYVSYGDRWNNSTINHHININKKYDENTDNSYKCDRTGSINKEHVFYNIETDKIFYINNSNDIAVLYDDTEYPDLANLYTRIQESDDSNIYESFSVSDDLYPLTGVISRETRKGNYFYGSKSRYDEHLRCYLIDLVSNISLYEKIDDNTFYKYKIEYTLTTNSSSYYSKYVDRVLTTKAKRVKVISIDKDNIVTTKNVPKKDLLELDFKGDIDFNNEKRFVNLKFKKGKYNYYI